MVEIDIDIPPVTDLDRAAELVEDVCARANLSMSMKGTLARYPGCIHWHFKQGRERGTLEITLWPAQRRLWFTVHENRRAEWIAEAISHLKDELETSMSK